MERINREDSEEKEEQEEQTEEQGDKEQHDTVTPGSEEEIDDSPELAVGTIAALDAVTDSATIMPKPEVGEDIKVSEEGIKEAAAEEIAEQNRVKQQQEEEQQQQKEGEEQPSNEESNEDDTLTDDEIAKLNTRKRVEYLLLHGTTREDLIDDGYNSGTVKTIISELKSRGLLKDMPRGGTSPKPEGGFVKVGSSTAVQRQNPNRALSVTRGTPPEILVEQMHIPDISGVTDMGKVFEQGMKFGVSNLILSVRIMQELASIGTQQAKPIIDMAKQMREGEAQAAKIAATDASGKVAGELIRTLGPELESIHQEVAIATEAANQAKAATKAKQITLPAKNPMQAIISKYMDPLMGNLMQGMMGMVQQSNPALLAGGVPAPKQIAQGGDAAEEVEAPEGWERKSE